MPASSCRRAQGGVVGAITNPNDAIPMNAENQEKCGSCVFGIGFCVLVIMAFVALDDLSKQQPTLDDRWEDELQHERYEETGTFVSPSGGATTSEGLAASTGVAEGTARCMRLGTCSQHFFPGTELLGGPYGQMMNDWRAEMLTGAERSFARNQEWVLCYSTFLHAHDVFEFHARCDMYDKTITVARNEPGYLFGGYADESWGRCSPGAGISREGCEGNYDQRASANFLFGLATPTNSTGPMKHLPSGGNEDYQCSNPILWPTWGRGADLSMGRDGPPGEQAYCDLAGPNARGHTYAGQVKGTCGPDDENMASYDWGTTQLEVWRRAD